mmetsp:Transcript_26577/g.69027  ORF Transcript_26577/g.69027 Transcript_26577/m.69027 type:complete len:299 (-) Transcript_26577:12-908(-)
MDVLDSARKRKSAFAAQLADQDAAMAQLKARLEAARLEGERLKERAEVVPDAPEAPPADTSVAVVVSEPPAVEADAAPVDTAPVTPPRPPPPSQEATPTTADLLALAATTNPLDESNGERCAACGDDAYALRSQLVPCTSCGRAFHAGCVRLRAIPFRGSTRADRKYRELFVKRYFGDWMCRECERRPAVVSAPRVAAPAGCASCVALTARVAELEKARLTDVPREVRSEIYQTAALEKENADLRERLEKAEQELARYRAREDWPGDPYGAGEIDDGSAAFRDFASGLAAAAQGGGSV